MRRVAAPPPLHAKRPPGAPELWRSLEEVRDADATRARLAAIVKDSQDAIVSKTLDGVITSWNGSAERLFGYTAAEAVGQPIALIIPPERLQEETDILARLRSGERIESYETERVRKDGGRVEVSLTISPLYDSERQIIGASKIARDIGARKLEERRRQAAEEALRTADRRKDEFLAIMAHELRNPLAPLVNSLDVLKQANPDPAVARDLLDIAHRQVHTLVRLVDDLMEVSRIGRGVIELRREPVDVGIILGNAVEMSRPLIDAHRQRLELAPADETLTVHGDRTRLTQVVANLLNNAAKYSGPQGRIELGARRDGDHVVIRVADNGSGIPPELLPRVFDMFTQLDTSPERTGGGLGIGLSIVRRLVELHGGTVKAHSAGLGHGSAFTVRLPLA